MSRHMHCSHSTNQMLSRVAECTARTPTDIRIYAEKAAFEGQALRSMINGLQTRTKYRLSDTTKSFAERCYEGRLLFYFCETLRACIDDPDGRKRVIDAMDEPMNDEDRNLRNRWEPVFDNCSDILRSKSLDAAILRLSKLSDLWKKRSCSTKLLALVENMARSLLRYEDVSARDSETTISTILQLPNDVAFIARGECYHATDDGREKTETLKPMKKIVVIEQSETAQKYACDFIASFVKHHCKTIRLVCGSKDAAVNLYELFKIMRLHCEIYLDTCSNLQISTSRVVVTSLDFFAGMPANEDETVVFLGLEELYFARNEVVTDESENELLQYITDIHIWGNLILHHVRDLEICFNNGKTTNDVQDIYRTWPQLLRDVVTLQELSSLIKSYRTSPLFSSALMELAIGKITSHVPNMMPPSLRQKNQRTSSQLANNFLKARQMEIDVHYAIVAIEENSEPTLRVQLYTGNDEHGLRQFIELRHGCQLTPCSRRYRNRLLIENCSKYFVILRSEELKNQYSQLSRLHKESNPNPSRFVEHKFVDVRKTKTGVQYFVQFFSRYNSSASHSAEISDLILKKRDLYKQLSDTEKRAQMVHILREPIGGANSTDLRSDGFVQEARARIEKIRLKLDDIDEALSKSDPGCWPVVSSTIMRAIASNVKDVDWRTLEQVCTHFHRKKTTIDELMRKIVEKSKDFYNIAYRWNSLERRGMMKNVQSYFALAPDTISEATHFLQHLQLVDLPPSGSRIQQSNRYIADCSFYSPTIKPFDGKSLLLLEGASVETFATCDTTHIKPETIYRLSENERAIIGTANKRQPFFLYQNRLKHRIARELVRNGLVNCIDASTLESRFINYETLNLPFIYNPNNDAGMIADDDGVHSIATELQAASLDFGSSQWMFWLSNRLISSNFHDSVLAFYRRSIAEREFCKRDEMLIKRIRMALSNPSKLPITTNLDQIAMDAFVNSIVEKITRGERLVEIEPPFSDEKTAEKLARFIRSRRMPPTDY